MYIHASTLEDEEARRSTKNWNFPKLHALQHAFDDIEAKGASRNYNTKPNEKMHGPLKKAYQLRTNFKDVASQAIDTFIRYSSISLTKALSRF